MNIGPIPVVAVGTLSGNLPTGAGARTLGAPAQAAGASFQPVSLDGSKALTGITMTPFATPKITADVPVTSAMMQELLLAQEQSQS